jgi:hypothetical protein
MMHQSLPCKFIFRKKILSLSIIQRQTIVIILPEFMISLKHFGHKLVIGLILNRKLSFEDFAELATQLRRLDHQFVEGSHEAGVFTALLLGEVFRFQEVSLKVCDRSLLLAAKDLWHPFGLW